MRLRAVWAAAALVVVSAVAGAMLGVPAPSGAQELPPPAAWILVDADSGAVLSASNEAVPMRPASTVKLLTALVAVQRLPASDGVPISALAESMPARKINVKAGQVWSRDDLLHSMLLVSANDAAVALAERIGGSLDGYARIAASTAQRLGLEHDPVLHDPAGLDDEFSHAGGSWMSARDLAVVARAALAEPDVARIASTPGYDFTGGDGLPHHLTNHNRFLREYPGAIGLKTGTTEAAGRCFVAAATRDGRTMIAVMFEAPNIYAFATHLLDHGFATPVASQAGLAHLPDVVPRASIAAPARRPSQPHEPVARLTPATADDGDTVDWNSPPVAAAVFIAGVVPLAVLVRRRRAFEAA
jgi:serine-type D-Ala-D-Ala carboxypeptidase (penicillin-binding protein 5/6)